jgi:hypothetical protein
MSLAVSAVATGHAPQLREALVFLGTYPADRAADTEFGEELESPAGDGVIETMPSVREVEVEDGFEGLRGFRDKAVGADVDASVGEGGDDIDARRSKGSRIAPWYRSSAMSDTMDATSHRASSVERMDA